MKMTPSRALASTASGGLERCWCSARLARQPPPPSARKRPSGGPRYEHIFLIIEENKSYTEIVGDQSVAPNINRLAKEYGLATQFYAEVHPSEANYIAMLGGDTFGIHDDDAYYCKPKSSDPFCPASGRAGLRGSHRCRAQPGGSARGAWTDVEGLYGKHPGAGLRRGSMADGG